MGVRRQLWVPTVAYGTAVSVLGVGRAFVMWCWHDGVCLGGCAQGGHTPIFIAAQNGHKECVEALANLGGDVNQAAGVRDWMPQHSVVGAHDNGMRSVLSTMWPRVDCVQDGFTPIHIAAQKRRTGCVLALLEAGADPNKAMAHARLRAAVATVLEAAQVRGVRPRCVYPGQCSAHPGHVTPTFTQVGAPRSRKRPRLG